MKCEVEEGRGRRLLQRDPGVSDFMQQRTTSNVDRSYSMMAPISPQATANTMPPLSNAAREEPPISLSSPWGQIGTQSTHSARWTS